MEDNSREKLSNYFDGSRPTTLNSNPLLECPNCRHRFRVTPYRVFDPQNETLCVECHFHAKGIYFEISGQPR
jgi:hypothetical protein